MNEDYPYADGFAIYFERKTVYVRGVEYFPKRLINSAFLMYEEVLLLKNSVKYRSIYVV